MKIIIATIIALVFAFRCKENKNENSSESIVIKATDIGIDSLKKYAYRIKETITNDIATYWGTGFFVKSFNRVFFVTARHMLFDAKNNGSWRGVDKMNVQTNLNGKIFDIASIDFNNGHKRVLTIFSKDVDVIAIEIAENELSIPINSITEFPDPDKINIGMDIYLAGFPNISDAPTVTKSQIYTSFYSSDKKFELDLQMKDASKDGASGSPIFIILNSRMFLLGIDSGKLIGDAHEHFTNSLILKEYLETNFKNQ